MNRIENDLIKRIGLPFDIMDMVLKEDEKTVIDFKLRLCDIDKNQDMELIKSIGLAARFDVLLKNESINACILTGLTVGNVYKFYNMLKIAYEKSDGYAELKEYGRNSGTDFSVVFDADGMCEVKGEFSDKGQHKCITSGIRFEFDCEMSVFKIALQKFELMFRIFAEIQENERFEF